MNGSENIKKIVIVGGGTAGWMTAAGLSHVFRANGIEIALVESDQIGTIGVGEATLPHLRFFNEHLGIDESEFMARTSATFKLGIEFRDWGRQGDAYIHPFGEYGREIRGIDFHHFWLKAHKASREGRIDSFSLPVVMGELAKFAMPSADPRSVMASYSYAYQLDAGLYAKFLREFAEARGVQRIEGKIVEVSVRPEGGVVDFVTLENDRKITGDLFIDCSGFRGLIIEQALKAGYEDWSQYLPCDRAVAVPCEMTAENVPYTRATAREAGWQWRIPLQHRVGNGYVFSSRFTDDERASDILMSSLEGAPLAEPKFIGFRAGKRRRQWVGNCVAIGLSSGFLEPLESTSIYLIQAGITALAELLPSRAMHEADIREFNRVMDLEYERVRDFLILHYHATERNDSPFWDYVRTMPIPESLAYKLELFRKTGVVVQYKDGLFLHPSWIAVYLGQRVVPDGYDPRVDALPDEQLYKALAEMKALIGQTVSGLPTHADFLRDYCPRPVADGVL
ncbi:MAG: tryptophan halogenase family protein [Hyphomonas sp.]|uniref:tryptophan halogenase family protein n=1 Tax=Hyphomonas sp. TaxID=87 RepID=UPI003529452A